MSEFQAQKSSMKVGFNSTRYGPNMAVRAAFIRCVRIKAFKSGILTHWSPTVSRSESCSERDFWNCAVIVASDVPVRFLLMRL